MPDHGSEQITFRNPDSSAVSVSDNGNGESHSPPFFNNAPPSQSEQHGLHEHGTRTDKNDKNKSNITSKIIGLKTNLLATDSIYSRNWWEKPTVIEEFKLIFFTIPKVGCTEWKLMFRQMMGMKHPRKNDDMNIYRNPATNNLTTLGDYSLEEAERMMTSQEWTKAVFVREPKERILSAFIDKFVNTDHAQKHCCRGLGMDKNEYETCKVKREMKDFAYFLSLTQKCPDPHWLPQYTVIDEKWWPYVNFIGYMDNIADDARRLLQSITSARDGMSAWDKFGAYGWGPNRTSGFMQNNTAGHRTHAANNIRRYYSKIHESFVETNWALEWNFSYYHFEQIHLVGEDALA